MTRVFLSLGSNVDRIANIQRVFPLIESRLIVSELSTLNTADTGLACSPVYESPALTSSEAPYFNLAVGFTTDLSFLELQQRIKKIEQQLGRDRSATGRITMDIDVLLYGDLKIENAQGTVPHPDILRYRHTLVPLIAIAGELYHPVLQCPLAALMAQLDDARELVSVDDPALAFLSAYQLSVQSSSQPTLPPHK